MLPTSPKRRMVASARTSAAQPAVALRGSSPATAVQIALSRSPSAAHCRMARGPQPPDSAVLSGSAWKAQLSSSIIFFFENCSLAKI